MELPIRRKRRRPQRQFMDIVKEDMKFVCVTKEDGKGKGK